MNAPLLFRGSRSYVPRSVPLIRGTLTSGTNTLFPGDIGWTFFMDCTSNRATAQLPSALDCPEGVPIRFVRTTDVVGPSGPNDANFPRNCRVRTYNGQEPIGYGPLYAVIGTAPDSTTGEVLARLGRTSRAWFNAAGQLARIWGVAGTTEANGFQTLVRGYGGVYSDLDRRPRLENVLLVNSGLTATITIASPAVITATSHGRVEGDTVAFETTGALPSGLSQSTVYYVLATDLTANTFKISTSPGGSAVNTSGSQSGVHTLGTGTLELIQPTLDIDDRGGMCELVAIHETVAGERRGRWIATQLSNHGMLRWMSFSVGPNRWAPGVNQGGDINPSTFRVDAQQRSVKHGQNQIVTSGDPPEDHIFGVRVAHGFPECNGENPAATLTNTKTAQGSGFRAWNFAQVGSGGASISENAVTMSAAAMQDIVAGVAGAHFDINISRINDGTPLSAMRFFGAADGSAHDVVVGASSSLGGRISARVSDADKPSAWFDNTKADFAGTLAEFRIARAGGSGNYFAKFRIGGSEMATIKDTGEITTDVGVTSPSSDLAERVKPLAYEDDIKAGRLKLTKEDLFGRIGVLVDRDDPRKIIEPGVMGSYEDTRTWFADAFDPDMFKSERWRRCLLGPVSVQPALIGGDFQHHWRHKHLRNPDGSFIYEDVQVWEWVERKIDYSSYADDDEAYQANSPDGFRRMAAAGSEAVHHAEREEDVPPRSDVTVMDSGGLPRYRRIVSEARRVPMRRKKIDPRFDPTRSYIPQSERVEWPAWALRGQVPVRDDQHPFMRDNWVDLGRYSPGYRLILV